MFLAFRVVAHGTPTLITLFHINLICLTALREAMIRIERLRWDAHGGTFRRTGEAIECTPVTLEGVQPGRAQPARRFLKGPVPWAWIIAASALPGKALLVGLC